MGRGAAVHVGQRRIRPDVPRSRIRTVAGGLPGRVPRPGGGADLHGPVPGSGDVLRRVSLCLRSGAARPGPQRIPGPADPAARVNPRPPPDRDAACRRSKEDDEVGGRLRPHPRRRDPPGIEPMGCGREKARPAIVGCGPMAEALGIPARAGASGIRCEADVAKPGGGDGSGGVAIVLRRELLGRGTRPTGQRAVRGAMRPIRRSSGRKGCGKSHTRRPRWTGGSRPSDIGRPRSSTSPRRAGASVRKRSS